MRDPGNAAPIQQLRLLQLADSALPIGSLAHSFGLESLVQLELLHVAHLAEFLAGYLEEAGALEGYFCRAAHRLAVMTPASPQFEADWLALNEQLSALKPARESRAASGLLGRRLLLLLSKLDYWAPVQRALALAQPAGGNMHYSLAFGLAGGALALDEDTTVLAYLQQSLTGLVSACQRLLPLGQSDAARIVWTLKPAILGAAERSREPQAAEGFPACFMPLAELGSMTHATRHTRLFMS